MDFIVGHSYYWLTPDQFTELQDIIAAFGDEYGVTEAFLDDFTLFNGIYYADAGSVDESEDALLRQGNDLAHRFDYIKSTQLPGGM